MSDIFYLTDATKEQKIAYYEQMEKNWETRRKKEHNKIFAKAILSMVAMIIVTIIQWIPQEYGFEWNPTIKILLVVTTAVAAIGVFLNAKEMVMGRHQLPPVELVGWWDYEQEKYGIIPDWKKKG